MSLVWLPTEYFFDPLSCLVLKTSSLDFGDKWATITAAAAEARCPIKNGKREKEENVEEEEGKLKKPSRQNYKLDRRTLQRGCKHTHTEN